MRMIDADFVKQRINETMSPDYVYSVSRIENLIDEAPTIEVESVRYGRWKYVKAYKGAEFGFYQCSVCGESWWFRLKYCANCGAKMLPPTQTDNGVR